MPDNLNAPAPAAASSTTTETTSPTAPVSQTSAAPPSQTLDNETSHDTPETFEGLGMDFPADGGLEAVSTAPAVVPPKIPSVAAPVAAPAAVVPPVAPPANVPPAAPQVQQQPQQAAPQSTATQPVTPQVVIDTMEKDFLNLTAQIAPAFELSAELQAELQDNPMAAIPKVQAQTYMRAITTSLKYMHALVPGIISQYMADKELYASAENDFFKAFPVLDKTKHGNDITTYAKAFHAANPGISKAQLFALTGAAVMAAHGLQPGTPKSLTPAPQGFRPASSSAPVVHAQLQEDTSNVFAGLGREYDES